MIFISAFHLKGKIYESFNSLAYRAIRHSDNTPVIIKLFQQEYPSPKELARCKLEYEMTSMLLNG
jgi:hypothetical protein